MAPLHPSQAPLHPFQALLEVILMSQYLNVTISEVYDLHTHVGKIGLLGIHTPTSGIIAMSYPGLCQCMKKVRIDSVDVALSAVSSLPVSPDQVGLDVDDVAPEDMLNPILYKAVSNDRWSQIEQRIVGVQAGFQSSTSGFMVEGDMDPSLAPTGTQEPDHHRVYYSILGSHDGWRKAHPQQGMSMEGLCPLVYSALYTQAVQGPYAGGSSPKEVITPTDPYPVLEGTSGSAGSMSIGYLRSVGFRGHAQPMPSIPTTYITSAGTSGTQASGMLDPHLPISAEAPSPSPVNGETYMPQIPPVYVGAVLMPPARRTIMYYRMVVTCHLTFIDPCSISEKTTFFDLDRLSYWLYHSDYAQQSSKMSARTAMLDTQDVDVERVI